MKNLMIWCTCAENNKEHYLHNVEQWYKQVKLLFDEYKPDYLVFVDGTITQEEANKPEFAGLTFVCLTPKLGHRGVGRFDGWRRSFKSALEMSRMYNHCLHIENDVKILHTAKIFEYIEEDGFFVGWCKMCGFVETAFMILNDKDVNERILKFYSDERNMLGENIPERVVQEIARQDCKLVFETDRVEGNPNRFNPNYDYVCQYDV